MRATGNDVIMYARHPAPPEPVESLRFDYWSETAARVERLMAAEPATFGANIPVFTPDGRQFVHPWNFGDGIVDIYDVASGEPLERLTDVADAVAGGDAYMLVPRFAPDGNRPVTPSFEDWVAVYDPATWDLWDARPLRDQ